MDPKKQPNHALYLQILRRMTPEEKILKVFDLNNFGRNLLEAGIRNSHPEFTDAEVEAAVRRRLDSCHNQNY